MPERHCCSGIFTFFGPYTQAIAGGERGRRVKDHIWQRVVQVGNHILSSGATVRDTAKVFGVSKSTVHKDVTERLPKVNAQLANEVKKVLELNKAERHLRGGEATRQKFRGKRPISE